MPGDKLKRVKSVKRWLDKAENSYSNNKDISGELNLMIQQAEMQRLKETHPHEKSKRSKSDFPPWQPRQSCLLDLAICFLQMRINPLRYPGKQLFQKKKCRKCRKIKIWCFQKRYSRTVAATESSNTDPVPTKSIQTEAPAPVLPVMSQSEIQSVVGEAGRFKGQS